MNSSKKLQQFVLMPVRGLTVHGPTFTNSLHAFFTSMRVSVEPLSGGGQDFIIDVRKKDQLAVEE